MKTSSSRVFDLSSRLTKELEERVEAKKEVEILSQVSPLLFLFLSFFSYSPPNILIDGIGFEIGQHIAFGLSIYFMEKYLDD